MTIEEVKQKKKALEVTIRAQRQRRKRIRRRIKAA